MDHLDDTTVDSADIRKSTSKDLAVQPETNIPEGPLFHTERCELSVENGCLLWGSRVIIAHTLKQVLKEHHEYHLGMVKMKALARNYIWWPGMDADIEEKVNRCYTCQSSRTSPARVPLHPWELPRES